MPPVRSLNHPKTSEGKKTVNRVISNTPPTGTSKCPNPKSTLALRLPAEMPNLPGGFSLPLHAANA